MNSSEISSLAERLLGKSNVDLDENEHRVLMNIAARAPTSRDASEVEKGQASFGERLADHVAAIGGSWGFIITFAVVLISWMLLNTEVLAHWRMAFDPYPFIFLNLMLSMLAAIQAPIIMMSQNRQSAKDRLAANLDYQVNLRAELEIARIEEKLDKLISKLCD